MVQSESETGPRSFAEAMERTEATPNLLALARDAGLTADRLAQILRGLRDERASLAGLSAAVREHVPLVCTGLWRDVITYSDGRRVEGSFTNENLVVNAFSLILTGLCNSSRVPAYQGIMAMALGAGQPSWDTTLPSPQATDTILNNEFWRQPLDVPPQDVNASGAVVLTGPTGRLLMTATFAQGAAIGSIREFGLFGGILQAGQTWSVPPNSNINTGIMVNHIIHGVIVKSSAADFSLQRQIILSF